ncbi:MAG TPA: hypothetical protein VMT00_14750 [Thermoanaerobaculia bacterium]|nr:hypothetical protein [Thermoanaerobaculia bacterium]
MEIVAAVAVPALAFWLVGRRYPAGSDDRRAALTFIVLVIIWFAPCWLTNSTPVSLDFLTQFPPWSALRPEGHLDRNPLLNDVPLQFLPWREAVRNAYLSGTLPLLGRFASSGTPLWENPTAAVLHPLVLAGLPFSTFAWPLFAAVSKVLLALWGTYRFVRSLHLEHKPALLAAIAYGFGAFTITYLLFSHTRVTVLLPFLLLAIDRTARGGWRDASTGALVLFLMIAGGHPESVLHAAFIAVPWALRAVFLRPGVERLPAAGRMMSIGTAGILLSAPLLLPFAFHLPNTQRVADIATRPGFLSTAPFEARTFIPFVVPNYFGNPRVHNYRHSYNYNEMVAQYTGLVTLLFALFAAGIKTRRLRFWLVLLLVLVPLAIQPLWLYEMLSKVPILGVTAHSRLRYVIAFIIAVLGAFGYQALIAGERRRLLGWMSLLLFLTVSLFCIASYPLFEQFGVRRLIFFTEVAALIGVLVVWLASRSWNPGLRSLLPLLLFADLFLVVGLYNAANPKSLFYPKSAVIEQMQNGVPPYRIAGTDRALMPNTAAFFGLEDIRPHDPLSYEPYLAMLERGGLDRSEYFARFPNIPPKVLLDYLGVRYVLTAAGEASSDLEPIHDGTDGKLFANHGALARHFIPSRLELQDTSDIAGRFLGNESARVVQVDRIVPLSPGHIEIETYTPSVTRLRVTNEAPTFIATSEVALPGWRLEREGDPWPMQRVNGVFLGWSVPAGGGAFVLAYRPPFLEPGFALFFLGLLVMASMWVAGGRRTAPSAEGIA